LGLYTTDYCVEVLVYDRMLLVEILLRDSPENSNFIAKSGRTKQQNFVQNTLHRQSHRV